VAINAANETKMVNLQISKIISIISYPSTLDILHHQDHEYQHMVLLQPSPMPYCPTAPVHTGYNTQTYQHSAVYG
jgi:hypothetical protein